MAFNSSLTVGELFLKYFEGYARFRCRSKNEIRANFKRYFNTLESVPVDQLEPFAVQSWHNQLGAEHGEPTANRSLQLLRTLYNFGDEWNLLGCRNPARAIRKFKEDSRSRYLTDEELPCFFEGIEKHSTRWTKDIFLLCLYTAQRLQNVCGMRWADVDFKRAVWIIPSEDFKTGHAQEVPLVENALAILTNRARDSEWVFPSRRRDSKNHISYPYNGWRKVLKHSGLKDLKPHDLRRTHATYQNESGAGLPTIAKTLGHSGFQSTSIYTQTTINTVRMAMTRAVERMKQL